MIMDPQSEIAPFEKCPALDGCHCVTNSLAKIFYHNDHPLSENMLLGLGAGMGFILLGAERRLSLRRRPQIPKGFFRDLGERTGVRDGRDRDGQRKKAEATLVERLKRQEPVMVFGDMGYMPWFEFPVEYHFGGHTFVICGYDSKDRVLISDMDQAASGRKKGFYYATTMDKIRV